MNLSKVIFVAVVCAALGFGQAAQDQKPSEEKVAKPDAKKPAAAAEKPEPGGKSEGIKVHGHWVLEVRNPDGTLASRREFENALQTGPGSNGSDALATVLAGGATVGGWYVSLGFGTVSNNNCNPSCQNIIIAQAALTCTNQTGALSCNPSLTATVGGTGTQLILQGTSLAAPSVGTIPSVLTTLITCNPGVTPAACLGGVAGAGFTQWTFTIATPSPTSVQAGQTITAIVTFSFS